MSTIKLSGTSEIYSAVNVIDEPRPYRAGSTREGQFYYLGTVNGRGFTCGEAFRDAYKAGTLEQVSFSEGTYVRVDAATGKEVERQSATLGGYLTKDQVIAGIKGDKELIKAKAELSATERVAGRLAERAAYIDAGISTEEMKELMALA